MFGLQPPGLGAHFKDMVIPGVSSIYIFESASLPAAMESLPQSVLGNIAGAQFMIVDARFAAQQAQRQLFL